MFYPTKRAVLLMGLGLPITLIASIIAPALWPVGAAWIAFVLGLLALDMLASPAPKNVEIETDFSTSQFVGTKAGIQLRARVKNDRTLRGAEARIGSSPILGITPTTAYLNENQARFEATAKRRGDADIRSYWLRYTGPLRMIWWTKRETPEQTISIVPDTRLVKEKAIEFFSRDAVHGEKMQRDRGEGTQFDSLREFTYGMDTRAIDWKHSARHRVLHAKEFRTERNHNLVFAIDTGYLMTDPLDGTARLDWAINASLLVSYISLKQGDKIGFFGFDEKPYLYSKPVAGTTAFAHLQKLTGQLEYSSAETNFTLGLSTLSKSLKRRSLIIVYTEFIDSINAELMVENISRLIRNHLVIFVVFKDSELETLIDTPPQSPSDISRAVIADSIAKDREVVLARLERLGVHVVNTDIKNMGTAVLNRFLKLNKKR